MSIEDELGRLKRDLTEMHTMRIQLESSLKLLKEEYELRLIPACRELNVEPDKIAEAVALAEMDIQEKLDQIRSVMGEIDALRTRATLSTSK